MGRERDEENKKEKETGRKRKKSSISISWHFMGSPCLSLPPTLPPLPTCTGPCRPTELLVLPTLTYLLRPSGLSDMSEHLPPLLLLLQLCAGLSRPCPVHSWGSHTPWVPGFLAHKRHHTSPGWEPFHICFCSLFDTWHHGHSINIFHVPGMCQALS